MPPSSTEKSTHRNHPIRIAIATCLLLPMGLVFGQGTPVNFICKELLGRPTDRSVTIHACTDGDVETYFEYGTAPSTYTGNTASTSHSGGTPFFTLIDGLAPDTRYYYRVRYRPTGSTDFQSGAEHSFHTQRRTGSTFSFAVEADPHMDGNTVPALFQKTLENMLAGGNDFLIDLGDTFMSEKLTSYTLDSIRKRHLLLRSCFDLACHSVPLFLVPGNHEGELGWLLDGTATSLPVLTSTTRMALFPNPLPDTFYSGNSVSEPFVGLRQNYYAWEWGNALCVALDNYWYTKTKSGKNGDNWVWTLGEEQYRWFANVLANSKAKFKFVFAHQLIGGSSEGRGGAEFVDFYEMGGKNADSTWGFDAKRPGWELPLHQLMLKYHVNAFFHGHDHFYARQEKDGLTYQLVPQPGNSNFNKAGQAAEYGYVTGDLLPPSGYLRVTVGDSTATVDYIRSYRPEDENPSRHNGDITLSYVLKAGGSAPTATDETSVLPATAALEPNHPNPFHQSTSFRYFVARAGSVHLTIRDILGRMVDVVFDGFQEAGWHAATWHGGGVLPGKLNAGLYFVVLESGETRLVQKIMKVE